MEVRWRPGGDRDMTVTNFLRNSISAVMVASLLVAGHAWGDDDDRGRGGGGRGGGGGGGGERSAARSAVAANAPRVHSAAAANDLHVRSAVGARGSRLAADSRSAVVKDHLARLAEARARRDRLVAATTRPDHSAAVRCRIRSLKASGPAAVSRAARSTGVHSAAARTTPIARTSAVRAKHFAAEQSWRTIERWRFVAEFLGWPQFPRPPATVGSRPPATVGSTPVPGSSSNR